MGALTIFCLTLTTGTSRFAPEQKISKGLVFFEMVVNFSSKPSVIFTQVLPIVQEQIHHLVLLQRQLKPAEKRIIIYLKRFNCFKGTLYSFVSGN